MLMHHTFKNVQRQGLTLKVIGWLMVHFC